MFQITMKLELIYTTVDWPFKNASMNASLFQLGEVLFVILRNKKLIDVFQRLRLQGKSRADLWQLAALVALDLTVERANRACDLDFHARHQVSYKYW